MADPLTLAVRPPSPVAKAIITRDGDRYRVRVLDAAGDAVPHLCNTLDDHKAAYGYAGGIRMIHRCTIIDTSAPEVG